MSMDTSWAPLKYHLVEDGSANCARCILFVKHRRTGWIRKINHRTVADIPTYRENPKYLEYYSPEHKQVVARYPQVGDTVYWRGQGLMFGECVAEIAEKLEMSVVFRDGTTHAIPLKDLEVVWHNIQGMQTNDTEDLILSCCWRARTVEEIQYAFGLCRKETLEWMLKDPSLLQRPIDLELILEMHERIFGEVVSWGGLWRDEALVVGRKNWETPPPQQVPALMHDFTQVVIPAVMTTLASSPQLDRQKTLALARLYYEFCDIHPFRDGNGRISRLLIQLAALKSGHGVLFDWSKIRQLGNKTDRAFEKARSSKRSTGHADLNALANLIYRAI